MKTSEHTADRAEQVRYTTGQTLKRIHRIGQKHNRRRTGHALDRTDAGQDIQG